jgi:integrase
VPETKRPTITQAVETFITAKLSEGCGPSTIRKLRYQLGLFEQFLAERSKFFPVEITVTDVIEFRASWDWESGVTRQKAQQNLRSFLRSCCRENLADLLTALKTIRLSKADIARLEPQPFSEDEIQKLLAQIPVTFNGRPDIITRLTVLVHFMAATGVAIRDAVQMERANIAGGWLRFRRQKSNRPVEQRLDAGLCRELETLANGRYIFWGGTSSAASAAGLLQTYMRRVMKDADLWIDGNLFHRFRDTAVDYWFGQGASELEVATMLGDTVPIVERHYRKLMSKRLQARLAGVKVRAW